MFGITHRHTLDYAPAFPRPVFRFPDGTPLPIHAGDEEATHARREQPSDAPTLPIRET